jgi:hypothetical protein
MGRWVYVNYLIILVILIYMYRHFAVRYDAPLEVYVLATVVFILLAGSGFYIFHYRLKKAAGGFAKADVKIKPRSTGERPKVVLKKRRKKE